MPWYSSGTVSVTANSATVTGTGTAFSANARTGDAFRGPDGRWYEITNIASATVLSIKPNYQGATASGQAYAIAPMQGYVKESADRLRQLVDQYGSQLAALQPWATSATPAAARTALGAAPLASPALTGNPTAPTPAAEDSDTSIATTAHVKAAMALFGIGGQQVSTQVDLNEYRTGGKYITPGAGLVNLPAGWPQGRYIVDVAGGVFAAQTIHAGNTGIGNMAKRVWNGVVWSVWQVICHTGNILGTVSQSGGVPTGAIIERGSNANGEYVRFADGTQECYIPGYLFLLDVTANLEAVRSWTYPAPFTGNVPVANVSIQTVSSTHAYTVSKLAMNSVGLTSADIRMIASTSQTYRIGVTVRGRWF